MKKSFTIDNDIGDYIFEMQHELDCLREENVSLKDKYAALWKEHIALVRKSRKVAQGR